MGRKPGAEPANNLVSIRLTDKLFGRLKQHAVGAQDSVAAVHKAIVEEFILNLIDEDNNMSDGKITVKIPMSSEEVERIEKLCERQGITIREFINIAYHKAFPNIFPESCDLEGVVVDNTTDDAL